MTSPASPPQPGQREQISFDDILQMYKDQVGHLTHELVLANCRIKNRDETIEALLQQLDEPRKGMKKAQDDVADQYK